MNILYIHGLNSRTIEPADEYMPSTGYQYVGYTTPDKSWIIQRIDRSVADSAAYRYATNSNNASYVDYATAWTNKASLDYDYFYKVKP